MLEGDMGKRAQAALEQLHFIFDPFKHSVPTTANSHAACTIASGT